MNKLVFRPNDDASVINLAESHVDIWLWLYKNPDKSKRDWPGWKYLGVDPDTIRNQCFACAAAKKISKDSPPSIYGRSICDFCPLKWPDGIVCDAIAENGQDAGLHMQWESATLSEKSTIALRIANLPWKSKAKVFFFNILIIPSSQKGRGNGNR